MKTEGRVLAVDVGERRIGLAISDVTHTLARPLTTLRASGRHDALEQVVLAIQRLAGEEDGLSLILVGLPSKLDGSPGAQTAKTVAFIDALRTRTSLPVLPVDERLTSREAESRLALRERDWRGRKARLDAAAAAVFLQDYLDRGRPAG
jgi:putative holliday junction resolvase